MTSLGRPLIVLALTALILLTAFGSLSTASAAEKTNDPNIIYILADDKI